MSARDWPPLSIDYAGERLAGVDEVGRGPLVGSVVAAAQGLPVDGVFMLLAGALLLAIVLAPLAAAAAIRSALT